MKDGFLKVAAVTPDVTVADTKKNTDALLQVISEAANAGAKLIVTPELSVTGYTCGDLFLQDTLLSAAEEALVSIAEKTADLDALLFLGVPLRYRGRLYNTAAAIHRGRILGIVPKTHLPNYGEFYEVRNFVPGPKACCRIRLKRQIDHQNTLMW